MKLLNKCITKLITTEGSVERVNLLLRIPKVTGSYLGQDRAVTVEDVRGCA